MKGPSSLAMGGVRGQGVAEGGRSEACASSLHDHLAVVDHGHEFNPNQSLLGCIA